MHARRVGGRWCRPRSSPSAGGRSSGPRLPGSPLLSWRAMGNRNQLHTAPCTLRLARNRLSNPARADVLRRRRRLELPPRRRPRRPRSDRGCHGGRAASAREGRGGTRRDFKEPTDSTTARLQVRPCRNPRECDAGVPGGRAKSHANATPSRPPQPLAQRDAPQKFPAEAPLNFQFRPPGP